jgi:hypothetical protein
MKFEISYDAKPKTTILLNRCMLSFSPGDDQMTVTPRTENAIPAEYIAYIEKGELGDLIAYLQLCQNQLKEKEALQ